MCGSSCLCPELTPAQCGILAQTIWAQEPQALARIEATNSTFPVATFQPPVLCICYTSRLDSNPFLPNLTINIFPIFQGQAQTHLLHAFPNSSAGLVFRFFSLLVPLARAVCKHREVKNMPVRG